MRHSEMAVKNVQIRVNSIRSRGKIGGVIFFGIAEDENQYVVVCNYTLVPDASVVEKGQLWAISGTASLCEMTGRVGYPIKEIQIQAEAAELLRPSGRNIIAWIAESPDCIGIGMVKASKLFNRFGNRLVEIIEQSNIQELAEVLTEDAAQTLCKAFSKNQVGNTLLWLDQVGISRHIGRKILDFYREQVQAKIGANPYVLLSFGANWSSVDNLAQKRFGVQPDDPRRLEAAIEESLYRCLVAGHTCLVENELRSYLYQLVGSALAKKALMLGTDSRQYQQVDGCYQPTGIFLIEKYLAQRFKDMVEGEKAKGQLTLFPLGGVNSELIKKVIDDYEQVHGMTLCPEQRKAVTTSAEANLSLILGGPGTGKTTVLRALYAVLDTIQPGAPVFQLALAGMAAQRMTAATGRKSMTIAAFLSRIDSATLHSSSIVVVDEASMMDVILMCRLLRHLPLRVRLILVGDPAQLPPIGPGLVLHALADIPSVPKVELKVVKRQCEASGIPAVAAAILAHQVPDLREYSGKPEKGVFFAPCSPAQLDNKVQTIYRELGGNGTGNDVQVLSVTNTGPGGVRNINLVLHSLYQKEAHQVSCYHPEFGTVGAQTLDRLPLMVGDLVMYLENDYGLDLRNGSLGKIVNSVPITGGEGHCCICEFGGVKVPLKSANMSALRHSYSITVHKSQGSEFNRVIVPIRQSSLLDQTLIYTAVTRGIEQVVLVGDERAALAAIAAPASATRRRVTLPRLLRMAI